MKKKSRVKLFCKYFAFAVLAIFMLFAANQVLQPKYYFEGTCPYSTFDGFYRLKKDSVDVLFLGSSHTYYSFSPQQLYDEYGIRSYNLGSSGQPLVITYYWLKEALKDQNPKAVVLETYGCFPYWDTPLNTSAEYARRGMEYMHLSYNKYEMLKEVNSINEKLQVKESIFTNLVYHDRWSDLFPEDYSFNKLIDQENLKGLSVLYKCKKCGLEFEPYVAGSSTEKSDFQEYMKPYLDKIVDLCKENGIEIILCRSPFQESNISQYNALAAYSEEKGIEFIDYNEAEIYNEIGYDLANDNGDFGHANVFGMEKISGYIGKVLSEKSWYQKQSDTQWEKSREYYYRVVNAVKLPILREESDFETYMKELKNKNYAFLLVADSSSESKLAEYQQLLNSEFGMNISIMDKGVYSALVEDGQLSENTNGSMSGQFNRKSMYYSISKSELVIRDKKMKTDMKGINIMVFDPVSDLILDQTTFY